MRLTMNPWHTIETTDVDDTHRLLWVLDEDFDPDGFYGYDDPEQTEATRELIDNLNSGFWAPMGLVLETKCPTCGHWKTTDSLRAEVGSARQRSRLPRTPAVWRVLLVERSSST